MTLLRRPLPCIDSIRQLGRKWEGGRGNIFVTNWITHANSFLFLLRAHKFLATAFGVGGAAKEVQKLFCLPLFSVVCIPKIRGWNVVMGVKSQEDGRRQCQIGPCSLSLPSFAQCLFWHPTKEGRKNFLDEEDGANCFLAGWMTIPLSLFPDVRTSFLFQPSSYVVVV